MIENSLKQLGNKISRLRIAKNLKQSELAYEAGISARTLQRMEAGEVVKTDGVLKVLHYLGRLDDILAAIDTPQLSPYELAQGVTRGRNSKALQSNRHSVDDSGAAYSPRARVRGPRKTKQGQASKKDTAVKTPGKILWPEDQA